MCMINLCSILSFSDTLIENQGNKTRVEWIDAVRGFAICLVVLGHMTFYLPCAVKIIIYSFHMPLFFFLSGIFYSVKKENFISFFYKKMKTLLFPYVCFSIIWIFVNQIWGLLDVRLSSEISYKGLLLGMYAPLWFLPCLFCTQLILYPFVQNNKFYAVIFIAVIGLVVNYFICNTHFHMLPLHFDMALIACAFVSVGVLYRKYWINRMIPNWLFYLSLVLFPICTILNYEQTGKSVELYEGTVGNYIYFFLASYSGIIIVMKCFKMLQVKIRDKLSFFGINSLLIYALHRYLQLPVQYFLLVLITRLELSINNTVLMFIFSLISTCTILLLIRPVINIINYRFPWLLGRF